MNEYNEWIVTHTKANDKSNISKKMDFLTLVPHVRGHSVRSMSERVKIRGSPLVPRILTRWRLVGVLNSL